MKWLPRIVAGMLTVAVFLPLSAQIHGIPPSVTSLGGGHTLFNPPGIPASVTSLGPNGFCCDNRFPGNFSFGNNFGFGASFGFRHNRSRFFFGNQFPVFAVPVAVPVAVAPYYSVMYDAAQVDQSEVEDDGPAPTVFEHRARRYHRRIADEDTDTPDDVAYERPRDHRASGTAQPDSARTASSAGTTSTAPQAPETPQPVSILVFRDGHRLEVKNYAILGDTLYDLTPGHPRRILLADLDLSATSKINDDRGVDFTAPLLRK